MPDVELSDDDDAPRATRPRAVEETTVEEEVENAAVVVGLAKPETDRGFLAAAKNEVARFTDGVDSEFWVAVCFKDRASKETFLRALKLLEHGDKYINGHKLAAAVGIDIGDAVSTPRRRQISKRWGSLT